MNEFSGAKLQQTEQRSYTYIVVIITISQVLLSKPQRNRDYGTQSPGLIREIVEEEQSS